MTTSTLPLVAPDSSSVVIGILAGPLIPVTMPNYIPAIAPGRLFVLVGVATGLVTVASVGAAEELTSRLQES